ncbi:MAG: cyclic nucleotide-binding domain-containing protein [Sulfuritalea sp.]|nr:cyclic nucleotide-binding domain-containing protein [Sulfuritalea sp.]
MKKVLYILGQLDDADVEWLATNGRREKLPKGTVVIENGVRSDNLYIVIDGRLAVVLPNGFRLAEVGVGEILGEISLVISSPPTASVVVEEDCVVLAVSQLKLRKQLQRDAAFAGRFYRALAVFLANRMRSTLSTLGYGNAPATQAGKAIADEDDEQDADLLDDEVLDEVYNAGLRFERLLKKLAQ